MSKSYRYAYYVCMFTCRFVIMNIKRIRTNEYSQALVLPTAHKLFNPQDQITRPFRESWSCGDYDDIVFILWLG